MRGPLTFAAAALLLIVVIRLSELYLFAAFHSLTVPAHFQAFDSSTLRNEMSPVGPIIDARPDSWASFRDAPVILSRSRARPQSPPSREEDHDPYTSHHYEDEKAEERPLPVVPKVEEFKPMITMSKLKEGMQSRGADKGLGEANAGGVIPEDPVLLTEFIIAESDPNKQHTNQASSIVQVGPGDFLVAWFGGADVNAPDVAIWTARFRDGRWEPAREAVPPISRDHTVCGNHFSPPVPCKGQDSIWNPVLMRVSDEELLLFYKTGPHPSEWTGWMKRSQDGGQTWTHPAMLPPPITGPAKHKPIMLPNGVILAGASTESRRGDEKRLRQCWIDYSEDGGRTWQRHGPIPFNGGIAEPSLWIGDDMRVNMLARPASADADVQGRQAGFTQAAKGSGSSYLVHATSDKTGLHWPNAAIAAKSLPPSDAAADVVRLRDSRLLIVHNNSTAWGRSSLLLSMSTDGGTTWQRVLQLEDALSTDTAHEYYHPSIIQAEDDTVHITYTYRRQNIRHVVVDPRALKPLATKRFGDAYAGVRGHYDTTGPKWRPAFKTKEGSLRIASGEL